MPILQSKLGERVPLVTLPMTSSIMKNTIDSYKSLINYEISEKDLFSSGLLGVKTSLITTKEEVEGLDLLSSKIACTHPNFAAAIVEMFYEMDIKENDVI